MPTKTDWKRIEKDIDEDGNFSLPIKNGPWLQYMYQRIWKMTYSPTGNFVGIFLMGAPVHTRVPYEFILNAAEIIKKEILFRKFDDLV